MQVSTESQHVSATIVVHNGERYLAEALQSIAEQTRPSDEVLVIDGQSTDHTAQIAQAFPGVRYLFQPDRALPTPATWQLWSGNRRVHRLPGR